MTATARLYRRGQWQQDEDGHESVVDRWEIVTDSETETITNVLAASGLPAKDDPHAEKTAAIVVDMTLDHHDEVFTVWYLDAKYSTKIKTREDKPQDMQRTKGGMKSATKDAPAFYDARGIPLVNDALDLFEGLAKKKRLRVVNVTHNFTSIPNWFFELSDTLNASIVTIHGQTYDIATCKLTDIDMPDEPSRDVDGKLFWPVTYNVTIDPDGWYILLPNKGAHELVYQTRVEVLPGPEPPRTFTPWEDATTTAYDEETDAALKQIIKRRITTTEQQEAAGDIWLDARGQAQRVLSLRDTELGTGTMTKNSVTLTLSAGTFDTTGRHVGALVRVQGTGPKGRWLTGRIKSVESTTSATLETSARTAGTGKQVWLAGAIVKQFLLEDLASWSGVPLPNNQP